LKLFIRGDLVDNSRNMGKFLNFIALIPVIFVLCLHFYPNLTIYVFMLVDFHTSWKLFDSPWYAKYHDYLVGTLPERAEGMIPELYAENFTVDDVLRLSHDYTFPVVIRGLVKNATGITEWPNKEWWVENYADERILCGTLDNVRDFCTIKDFFQELKEGKPFYVSGASKIFGRHPELTAMAEAEKIPSIEPGKRMSTQIFMGLQDMGSDIHCAVGVNIFRQMTGVKKWWFIPPHQTAYLKPSFNVNGFSSHTLTKVGKNGETPSPWLNRLERYTSVLYPGDVLINPPYCWHGILNLGEPGDLVIGVPTRYAGKVPTVAAFRTNFLFNLVTGLTILKQYGSLENYNKVVDDGGDLLEDKIEANRKARMKMETKA